VKTPIVANLISFYQKVYAWFGSGSHHTPYAIFQKYAQAHNGGRTIGLIRASDTRMGGHFIAFQQLLRLKKALYSTVLSPEFLKFKVAADITKIIRLDAYWGLLCLLLKTVFPVLRILRLSAQQSPAMDKLYYCVRRTDVLISENTVELNTISTYDNMMSMLSKLKAFIMNNDGSDDESDDESTVIAPDEEDDDEDAAELEPWDCGITAAIKQAWLKRPVALVHSYSIAGWMTSPVEDVMDDARKNHAGDHIRVVEQLLAKRFPQDSTEKLNEMINKFWEEHTQFHSKIGHYANRDHIWKSMDLENNQSHKWHMKTSLKFTTWLGRFACRVCSKILSIGSAERAWGDVKKIKTDRRAHLSAKATKMQATIYGRHCSEKAKYQQSGKGDSEKMSFWDEDDFADLGLGKYGMDRSEIEGTKKNARIFRAWFEDWEKDIYEKCNPVHNQKLVEKYGGLSWRDLDDSRTIYTADLNDTHFCKSRKKGEKGYQVIAYEADYDESDNSEAYLLWNLPDPIEGDCAAIYDCIISYYGTNPDPYITINKKEDEDNDDESTDLEDENNAQANND
jgi:hypothetical protein